MRPFERGEQSLGNLTRTETESQQHRAGRRTAQKSAQQLDRARIRPVQVVENENKRPRLR